MPAIRLWICHKMFKDQRFAFFMICKARSYSTSSRKHATLHNSENERHKLQQCGMKSPRFNAFNIQLLPEKLHKQLFKECYEPDYVRKGNPELIEASTKHLNQFGLLDSKPEPLSELAFELPLLEGKNIDEHFQNIAKEQAGSYFLSLYDLITSELPHLPAEEQWCNEPGWTKYTLDDQKSLICCSVEYPDENAMVFDCEIISKSSPMPVMAVAVSKNAWYSWTSPYLMQDNAIASTLDCLVPMEAASPAHTKPMLVIGHNVGFDRARIREQYYPQLTDVRFLDTMSMHIAVSGFSSQQRSVWKAAKNSEDENTALRKSWFHAGSMNGLSDVHQFYCGSPVEKYIRDVFVTGTVHDVRRDFNALMAYCAQDVLATYRVLEVLVPLFFTRFPHPVTFAGLLEMGQMYLPVNANWDRYLKSCQNEYDSLNQELKSHLMGLANDACHLGNGEKYQDDMWLWDMDWTTQNYKLLKKPRKGWEASSLAADIPKLTRPLAMLHNFSEMELAGKDADSSEDISHLFTPCLETVWLTASRLPKITPHLPGSPKWYNELCIKEKDAEWTHGAILLSTLTRTTPKLLRMTWLGCPLHYVEKLGWGYLMHGRDAVKGVMESTEKDLFGDLEEDAIDNRIDSFVSHTPAEKVQGLPSGYIFHRLPHKDGAGKNVGSPMSKDFLTHIDSGLLSSADAFNALRCLEINKMCSYWRSSRDRILSQIVVPLEEDVLPLNIANHAKHAGETLKAIVPQVVVSGTYSRRAVERTWLTASNIQTDRIGSELKSMVQAPAGMRFVGADVDSQELWIASLLGDSASASEHGCTGLSWMTLQGNKKDGTDLHSKTAAAIGTSREQAKVFNYSRMYGAGKRAALRTLMQHNQKLSRAECVQKINTLYNMTKGDITYQLSSEALWFIKKTRVRVSPETILTGHCSYEEVCKIKKAAESAFGNIRTIKMNDLVAGKRWSGGIESHMFNKLGEIASRKTPTTPVLGCSLSQALVPGKVGGEFGTGRMNWVVQSSAVDYLHLMLVAMRWLIRKYSLNARFALSIHDEMRYLSDEGQCNDVALALQISNLLTRCMFAYKLGVHDLPLSVAFFSSVEIDVVLRKEASDDCVTPSNPHGLQDKYDIPLGEALTIHDVIRQTKGGMFSTCEQSQNDDN